MRSKDLFGEPKEPLHKLHRVLFICTTEKSVCECAPAKEPFTLSGNAERKYEKKTETNIQKHTHTHAHSKTHDNKPWMNMACARVDIRSLLIPFTRRDIALMCVICNHSFRQQLLFVSFMCVIGFFSLSVRLLNTLRRFAFVSDVCFCVDSLWPEITFLGWLSLDLCTFVVVAVVRWFFFLLAALPLAMRILVGYWRFVWSSCYSLSVAAR